MTTKPCPFCRAEIPELSRVCRDCGTPVFQKCAFCSREIVAGATRCPLCKTDLVPPPLNSPAASRPERPLGEERGIVVTFLLSFITCGIYQVVTVYQMGNEINRHAGKEELRPGLDLALTFLTCGLWGVYTMYQYPTIFKELTAKEGKPVDVVLPCILLMAGTYVCPALYFVAPLILQDELNKHWKLHREAPGS